MDSNLVKAGWKQVRGTTKYKDPQTGKLFILAYAIIVQEGRDNEQAKETDLKKQLRIMKDIKAMQDWDPHCERIDELYPPDKPKRKKRTSV